VDIDELTPNQKQSWLELYRIDQDVKAQARACPEDPFWQGKKDGIRTAWIYFNEALGLTDEVKSSLAARETSSSARSTDLEILRAWMKSAMYYIGEALWMDETGTKLHPLSRVNWRRWWGGYKELAKRGLVEPVDDTAFD
jgi:hypothetical protein